MFDEGDLWEIGVLFPIYNPNMERFERHYKLCYDFPVGSTEIIIEGLITMRDARINSLIFIGESSDQTRDDNANLINYGKYESFLIDYIIPYGNNTKIGLKRINENYQNKLLYSYLKNDCITIRSVAKNWQTLYSTDFSGLHSNSFSGLRFSREDSLDKYKGFSQCIKSNNYISVVCEEGLLQKIEGENRSLLNRFADKKIRFSSWVKLALNFQDIIIGNDIDEIISGPQNDDIDEGIGYNSYPNNIIDEFPIYDYGYITPYIRMAFYSDDNYSILSTDYSETCGEMSGSSINTFINKVVSIPSDSLSAKFAVYGKFSANPRLKNIAFYIDDAVIEHCIGTTKENDGYYKFDMNPYIDISTQDGTKIETEKDLLGIIIKKRIGDPNSRLIINATWKNRASYFVEDMRQMLKWNLEGFPIVLRTKMPSKFPNIIFCNMNIDSPKDVKGLGNERSDITVTFKEIAI